VDGTLYDGATAFPHAVRAEVRDGGLDLSTDSGWNDRVTGDLLKRIDTGGDKLRLGRTDMPGWRLTLPASAAADLAPLLGREELYGRWIDRIGLVPALGAFGAVAIAVVAIGHLAPQWIAPHVPRSWERNLGDAIVGDFGDNRCRNTEGQKALEEMVERLEPGATRGPEAIRVAALNIQMFNAAALPGGHIVVFKNAITETYEPDELAGILAHEIAHVRRRHVTEALIRELGIGALIRLFAGGIGANAEQLVSLSYTREAESEADADAIAMLRRAGISPKPTAELFDRLAENEGSGFGAEFLSSHPLTGGRAKRFAAAFDKNARYRPSLDQNQWDALFNVCSPPGKIRS
jgi:Zn-dependent protease with chaperone function